MTIVDWVYVAVLLVAVVNAFFTLALWYGFEDMDTRRELLELRVERLEGRVSEYERR